MNTSRKLLISGIAIVLVICAQWFYFGRLSVTMKGDVTKDSQVASVSTTTTTVGTTTAPTCTSLGSTTTSPRIIALVAPNSPVAQNIVQGTTNVHIATLTLTACHPVSFPTFQLKTTPPTTVTALKNIKVMVNGVQYGAIASAANPTGMTIGFMNTTSPLAFTLGETKILQVFADIDASAVVGTMIRLGVGAINFPTPTTALLASNTTSSNPASNPFTVISSCVINKTLSTTTPTGTITSGGTQKLASIILTRTGCVAPVQINQLQIPIQSIASPAAVVNQLILKKAGVTIGSTTAVQATQIIPITSTIIGNTPVTIDVYGTTVAQVPVNATVKVGISDGVALPGVLAQGTTWGNTLTFVNPTSTCVISAAPLVTGTTTQTSASISSFKITNTGASSCVLSSIVLKTSVGTGAQFQNPKLYDLQGQNTAYGTAVVSGGQLSFTNIAVSIPAGTAKTFFVKTGFSQPVQSVSTQIIQMVTTTEAGIPYTQTPNMPAQTITIQ